MKHSKGINTETLILETARELFMERGYENTSMQAIAEFCDLTKGGLYHHFASKEEILEKICARHYERVAEVAKEVMGREVSTLEKAHMFIKTQRNCELENYGYFSIYIRLLATGGNEQLKAKTKEYRIKLYLDYLTPLLEEGKMNKIFNFDASPELIALFMYQMEEIASVEVARCILEGSDNAPQKMLEIMKGLNYGCARLIGVDIPTMEYIINLAEGIDNYRTILDGGQ